MSIDGERKHNERCIARYHRSGWMLGIFYDFNPLELFYIDFNYLLCIYNVCLLSR